MSTATCLIAWFVFVVAVIFGCGLVALFSRAQRWEQQGERGRR